MEKVYSTSILTYLYWVPPQRPKKVPILSLWKEDIPSKVNSCGINYNLTFQRAEATREQVKKMIHLNRCKNTVQWKELSSQLLEKNTICQLVFELKDINFALQTRLCRVICGPFVKKKLKCYRACLAMLPMAINSFLLMNCFNFFP